VEAAKQSLSHYANRMGINPPQETTGSGLSLWLMQKDDGALFGIHLHKQNSQPEPTPLSVPRDLGDRIRSMARSGHQLEAIRELRMATNCSLQDAKAWLEHNC